MLGAWLDAYLAGASSYDADGIAKMIERRPRPSYEERRAVFKPTGRPEPSRERGNAVALGSLLAGASNLWTGGLSALPQAWNWMFCGSKLPRLSPVVLMVTRSWTWTVTVGSAVSVTALPVLLMMVTSAMVIPVRSDFW